MINIKDKIYQKALELGFSEMKVANAEPLNHQFENYKLWLDLGFNATMEWMENNLDKRKDVSLILDNVQSVITLAFNYNVKLESDSSANGKISSYAWGRDYHDVVKKKLIQLEKYIVEIAPEQNTKSYIDTGPVLERQWAEKAGLGWQGKNGMIINRTLGSYFFIGIIFTTLPLPYDTIDLDRCGHCTKCIDACPTNAIVMNKVVDSNKCIAYWTIESKPDVEFPEDIAKNLKGWIFGCDICQDVCPWNNHRVKPQIDENFQPRNNETFLDLANIMEMTQEEFSVRFSKSPIKRTKLAGLKRNASTLLNIENVDSFKE